MAKRNFRDNEYGHGKSGFYGEPEGGVVFSEPSGGNHDDEQKTCKDCGVAFIFSAGEKRFFQQKGFNPPQRCPGCRAARKAQKEASGG